MDQQKPKSFRFTLSHLEVVLLYLSIAIGLYTVTSLSRKLDSLSPYFGKETSTKTQVIGKFLCGAQGRFFYAFQFLENGKVKAWVEPLASLKLEFPPRLLPQFRGVFTSGAQGLQWSINMFGTPHQFEESTRKKKNFTSELCEQLAGPSAQSKAGP